MIMGPPEESVESQHSYCPNDDKLGVSTTKIKYLTEDKIDQNVSWRASYQCGLTQNQNESINKMVWSKCLKRVYVAKAGLLFLFVNEMK